MVQTELTQERTRVCVDMISRARLQETSRPKNRRWLAPLILLLLSAIVALFITIAPRLALAQEVSESTTVALGSGLSLGKGQNDLILKRSPLFLDIDVGLVFDGDHAYEWTPSLIMELEGRVSVGVAPGLKRMFNWKLFSFYGGVSFPFYFAPFTLLGIEPALGAVFHFTPIIGLALEIHSDVFFLGSDLPENRVLAKVDASLGLRLDF